MSENGINPIDLHLETGYLCLDFANTAEWHASEQPAESLKQYADLVVWAQNVGLLSAETAAELSRVAAQRPAEAAAVWNRAIQLREVIYRLFSATAAGRPPDAADVAQLNQRKHKWPPRCSHVKRLRLTMGDHRSQSSGSVGKR